MHRRLKLQTVLITSFLLSAALSIMADSASAQLFRRGGLLRRCRPACQAVPCTPCRSVTGCPIGTICPESKLGVIEGPMGVCLAEICRSKECGTANYHIVEHPCGLPLPVTCDVGNCFMCLPATAVGDPEVPLDGAKARTRKQKFNKLFALSGFPANVTIEPPIDARERGVGVTGTEFVQLCRKTLRGEEETVIYRLWSISEGGEVNYRVALEVSAADETWDELTPLKINSVKKPKVSNAYVLTIDNDSQDTFILYSPPNLKKLKVCRDEE